jgi:hypothetical protein
MPPSMTDDLTTHRLPMDSVGIYVLLRTYKNRPKLKELGSKFGL